MTKYGPVKGLYVVARDNYHASQLAELPMGFTALEDARLDASMRNGKNFAHDWQVYHVRRVRFLGVIPYLVAVQV